MSIEELNRLVERAYAAAFAYEDPLTRAYLFAFDRAAREAADKFSATVIVADGFVAPPNNSLTTGMTEEEQADVNRIRDLAAGAIAAALIALGLAPVARSFMQTIAQRGSTNFDQELLRVLKTTVQRGLEEGWTADETALAIRNTFSGVSSTTAQMLAQTELTTLVNERSIQAAQRATEGNERPTYKIWETMRDPRVRAAHASAQGQRVQIDQPFSVGGHDMMYPGDPSAPLTLTARCRCRMSYSDSLTASAQEVTLMSTVEQLTTSTLGSTINLTAGVYAAADVKALGEFLVESAEENGLQAAISITISDDSDPGDETDAAPEVMADGPAWKGLLAIEGVETEDGRMLAEGSLTWRNLPLSLTAMDTSNHGAEGEAVVAGRIDRIWRDGNEIWGEGVFNTDEFGMHIYELVSNQSLRGNSIEPAVLSYEIRNRETGEVLDGEAIYDAMFDDVPLLTVFLEAVIMASTIVATPAIADANIVLAAGVLRTTLNFMQESDEAVLTASAAGMAPLHPPGEWFENPHLDGPTPLTVTKEGRVYGHAALWNSCHIGEPSGPGICVPPPRSGMSYEIFHHGAVETDEGVDIPCGQITMSTFHAGRDLGWKAAQEHYEHSGCAVADVVAGEDRHGIWVTGGLRPDLPAERVREMKAGSLSGDWREVLGRGLEFLSALVVNIPGFPIPRPEARIVASATGEEQVLALVAAGIVTEEDVEGMTRREYLRKVESLTREEKP